MFTRIHRDETDVLVRLEEPLTSDSCCKLITELIKYLLYQKQQIPVTFEYLLRPQSSRSSDRSTSTARTIHNYLESISNELNLELNRHHSVVKEIVIAMGATLLTPKLCVRVSLPNKILSNRHHIGQQHPGRKSLLNLMRSMLESEEFQKAMTAPLVLTNTFVLVKKSNSHDISEYFLPKPRYMLPTQNICRFHIRLNQEDEISTNCKCDDMVHVYHDYSNSDATKCQNVDKKDVQGDICDDTNSYQWYQSKDVIKGFKHIR